MIIKGNIGKTPEKHSGQNSGRAYYSFRIAENYGRDGDRKALWFDVVAAIPSLEADMLAVGQVVSAEGRLEAQPYIKKKSLAGIPVPTTWEGVIKCLHDNNTLAVGLKLFTKKVIPDHFERAQKNRAASAESQSPAPIQAKAEVPIEPQAKQNTVPSTVQETSAELDLSPSEVRHKAPF